jgi:hypothetical protein
MLGRQRVIAKCAASDSPIPFKYKEWWRNRSSNGYYTKWL